MTFYHHIFRPRSNEIMEGLDIRVIKTGSLIGRFIFRKWSPIVVVENENFTVINCRFECDDFTVIGSI